MHILIVPKMYPSENNRINGIFFKEQAEAISNIGKHKVGVLSVNELFIRHFFKYKKNKISIQQKEEKGVNIFYSQFFNIPKLKKINVFIRLNKTKRLFKKYIKKYGLPDILHLHIFESGEFANYVKSRYGINYIVTEHLSYISRNLLSEIDIKRAKKTYSNSSYNIAVSMNFATELTKKFNIHFNYIPNFIDTSFFSLKEEKKTAQELKTFINIAHLNKNKNQLMLINAFAKAFEKDKKYKLIIVGDGAEKLILQNEIKKLAMEQYIILNGVANRLEIRDLLQKSDYFVLSSIYETFGIVLIEAMSCGLPVVSTKNGGAESIIDNNELGILCEKNIESMANALKEITEKKYNNILIRNYVLQNFSAEIIVKKLSQIYEQYSVK